MRTYLAAVLGVPRAVSVVDQLAGPRELPAWFGPSIGRILRQQDAVIAATRPRELEQVVAELTGTEVCWALNEGGLGGRGSVGWAGQAGLVGEDDELGAV